MRRKDLIGQGYTNISFLERKDVITFQKIFYLTYALDVNYMKTYEKFLDDNEVEYNKKRMDNNRILITLKGEYENFINKEIIIEEEKK